MQRAKPSQRGRLEARAGHLLHPMGRNDMSQNRMPEDQSRSVQSMLLPAVINFCESAGNTLTLAAVIARILLSGSNSQASTNSEANHDKVGNTQGPGDRRTAEPNR